MKLLLSDKFITHQLTCPPDRHRIEYCDSKIPGLFIEVRSTSPGQGTYYLRFKDDHRKTRYRKIGRSMDISLTNARKTAQKYRAALLLGQMPGTDQREQAMTFSEFFEEKYLPFAKPRKRSWRDDELLYNRRLRNLFGSLPLNMITRHALQQMHSDLRATLSASSCDHHLGLMSRCLKLAQEWKLIDENPAQGLKKYNEDNRRDRLLTDDELQRLMHALDTDPARTGCLVLKWCLYTACRKGEALQLHWSDINRDTNTWTIQAANAKSKRRRIVPLNSRALAILDELSVHGTTDHVFRNSRNGERLQSVDKVFQRVRRSAGLEGSGIVVHSLRHQGASMMLASGTDLATVRDILGHADISTTEKYLHASGESLRSGAEGIDGYLNRALNGSS